MENLIKIPKDSNLYDYKWTVDGNRYGTSYDVTTANGFGDEKLIADGWEEVLAVNGGLFYTYESAHYACGLEKSRGVNNQDIGMTAVSDYNDAGAIACIGDELWFGKQDWIIANKLEEAYGALTGMMIVLNGKACTYGKKEFSSQWNTKSGRTIIGEDKDGNFLSYSIAGETGKTGITGAEASQIAIKNGFYNAIMLDGGGSVWRRYLKTYDITTSRKVKNALLLYRRKKSDTPVLDSTPMFSERLSDAGIKNNKFWYDYSYNRGASAGLYLPNCTTYTMGRMEEIANDKIKLNQSYHYGGFPVAKNWYKDSDLEKGQEPKVGGALCWGGTNDKYGHVATVERVVSQNGDGSWNVLISQSNYEGTFFEVKQYTVAVGKKTAGVGYVYNGCIYNPGINDIRTTRDSSKRQVEVLVEKLCIRDAANGNKLPGRYCAPGLYDILLLQKVGDYTWAKLQDNQWIALNDEANWTKTYEPSVNPDDDDDAINETIKELQAELDAANSSIEALEKENNDLKTQNIELNQQLNQATKEENEIKLQLQKANETIEEIKTTVNNYNKN